MWPRIVSHNGSDYIAASVIRVDGYSGLLWNISTIANGLTTWTVWSSNSNIGKRFFSYKTLRPVLGPTPSLLLKAHRGSFPGIQLPRREVNNSPPTTAQVMSEWSHTSIPPVSFHGVDRENDFTFTDSINSLRISKIQDEDTQNSCAFLQLQMQQCSDRLLATPDS
jgi:hypothetical protein